MDGQTQKIGACALVHPTVGELVYECWAAAVVPSAGVFISHLRYTARFVKLVPSLYLLYFRAD